MGRPSEEGRLSPMELEGPCRSGNQMSEEGTVLLGSVCVSGGVGGWGSVGLVLQFRGWKGETRINCHCQGEASQEIFLK